MANATMFIQDPPSTTLPTWQERASFLQNMGFVARIEDGETVFSRSSWPFEIAEYRHTIAKNWTSRFRIVWENNRERLYLSRMMRNQVFYIGHENQQRRFVVDADYFCGLLLIFEA